MIKTIETEELVLSLPEALPSAVVRNWPKRSHCTKDVRREYPDGRIEMCALGIMAEVGGIDWSHVLNSKLVLIDEVAQVWSVDEVISFLGKKYGLTLKQCREIYQANDSSGGCVEYLRKQLALTVRRSSGKDLAADVIERMGL